jgi:hypothetical protein
VNQANVIKWMQALPASRRVADSPERPDRAAPRRKAAPCTAPAPVHPLPDPALARLCAVPDSAPPYDDEAPCEPSLQARHAGRNMAASGGANIAASRDGNIAASASGRGAQRRPPPGRPAPSPQPAGPAGRAREKPGGRARGEPGGRRPPATPPWPSQFAQILAETLAGARSSHQLSPWTTERARGHIRRLGPLLSASQQPRIRRVVANTPAQGIVELTVVVKFGPRVRALAVRLERADRGAAGASWLCTAIEAA